MFATTPSAVTSPEVLRPQRRPAKCLAAVFGARNIAANDRTVDSHAAAGTARSEYRTNRSVQRKHGASSTQRRRPLTRPSLSFMRLIAATEAPAHVIQRHVLIGRRRPANHGAAANHATPP